MAKETRGRPAENAEDTREEATSAADCSWVRGDHLMMKVCTWARRRPAEQAEDTREEATATAAADCSW